MDMKKFYRLTYLSVLTALLPASLIAGNGERAGTGGATELLINPWARSSGFGGFNSSNARGVEALNLNVGGLAYTKKTEVIFSRTNWLKGSDVSINAFGMSQRVSSDGVLGVSIMSMNFGDIDVTTNERPEGGIGKFSPQLINFALAYSKEFSNSIRGGVAVRGIQQSIADLRANGFCLDAGIQYSTGDLDQFKLGISLRNIGPDLVMAGDGMMANFVDPTLPFNVEGYRKSQAYQLPSLLNIGLSYDFYLNESHRVTALGNFTSNAFSNDQIGLGAEYGYKKYLMLRAGYNAQSDITNKDLSPTVYTGLSMGATFEVPLNDKGASFGIDYAYSPSYVFDGTHVIGARITL
jgi:hypothetical protein